MSDYDEETTCPLCMDPLDATDQAINFCRCGYKMCLWCWNQLMETASRESLPGRCPNCRTEYDKDKITMAQLDPDVIQREQQRKKEQTKKKAAAESQHRPPRSLGQVRVVQRTLVYAVGMPLGICREETLADRQYFGQFGRIKKVSVNRSTPFSQVQKSGPSGSAYVTYYRPEDALRCIEAIDGSVWEGKTIKACFGTTKYCNAFLKGVPCNNPDCLYLHDIAESADSFSKEDMMANGLATGRSTFFDLVHPTNTKEASAHAHAVLHSMGSGSGGGSGAAASSGGPGGGGGACSSSISTSSASSCGVAAPVAGRPASQPMAITGVRRPSNSAGPWGSGAGDGPATASPGRSGAAAMAANAARWGSLPRATPPSAVPLNSPLADVEWPSLGAPVDAADAPKHAAPAADSQHALVAAAGQAGGGRGAAAVPHPHHPSASASSHPVSHPVGHHTAAAGAAAAPTAAAVVAGKVPAGAAAASGGSKQQQQQQQQQQQGKLQQQKAIASGAKNAKAAMQPTAAPAIAAKVVEAATAAAPPAKGKQPKAEAAAAAAPLRPEAVMQAAMQAVEAPMEPQQQRPGKEAKAEAVVPAAAPVVVAEKGTSSGSNAAQANGKLTKQESKKAAKAAVAAKQAAEKEAAKAEKVEAAKAAKQNAAAAVAPAAAAEPAGVAGKQADKQASTAAAATDAAAAPAAATSAAASKAPPPGFAGATPGRVKGPPPGFQGPAAAVQQRPPPPGFEPTLLALARGSSSTSLGQLASQGNGAPPGVSLGLSPLGVVAAAGAAAGAGSTRGAGSPGAAPSANGGGTGSRCSSDVDSAGGAAAAGVLSDELAPSTGIVSRPQSRSGSLQGAALTPAKPAVSGSAAVASAAVPSMATPPPQQQQQQQRLLFGGTPVGLSPLLGLHTPTPAPPQLFGPPATAQGSSVFDVNAFFDAAGPYAAPGTMGAPVGANGGSLFGASPVGVSPLAAMTPGAGGLGSSPASADGAVPFSTRKQSRFSFAQQPQQQQAAPAAVPAPVTPAPQLQPLQQPGARAPPGFAGLGSAAEPGAAAATGGFGGFAGGAFAGQHAASFFKSLLPGVNVHVAASPPTPPAAAMGPPAVGVAGVAPFPLQAQAAVPPNPGLALLQQLQRGSQQR